MTEETRKQIGFTHAVNHDHLNHVVVKPVFPTLSGDYAKGLKDLITPKQCFNNSVLAAEYLGAESVVLGFVILADFGVSIEHAWIEKTGVSYDPTLEVLSQDHIKNNSYYSLIAIPTDSYLSFAESIGSVNYAIDIHSLRRSEVTKHLFQRIGVC